MLRHLRKDCADAAQETKQWACMTHKKGSMDQWKIPFLGTYPPRCQEIGANKIRSGSKSSPFRRRADGHRSPAHEIHCASQYSFLYNIIFLVVEGSEFQAFCRMLRKLYAPPHKDAFFSKENAGFLVFFEECAPATVSGKNHRCCASQARRDCAGWVL